ncbi:unnamed protein product [Bursaphelenchus xylophilus]|uniref:(pine wood nematode) hypothetical protein n=1 Tax=Bursaphelenchus xylophilus TaxID=6326 RepID=A0A1I7SBC7_BURXY|nr:unnamed protein product [Bursaphelenchus xylophilus]CAG9131969.1 unnamed protein product [Bursaphelenchus xylophilus]
MENNEFGKYEWIGKTRKLPQKAKEMYVKLYMKELSTNRFYSYKKRNSTEFELASVEEAIQIYMNAKEVPAVYQLVCLKVIVFPKREQHNKKTKVVFIAEEVSTQTYDFLDRSDITSCEIPEPKGPYMQY